MDATLMGTYTARVLPSGERFRALAHTRRARVAALLIAARALLACGTIEITPVFEVGVGGSAGAGGEAGTGSGGAAGALGGDAGPSCPAAPPPPGSNCEAPGGTRCSYALAQCLCFANRWECTSCPEAEPARNDPCNTLGGQCVFGDTECSCFGGAWACGVCPSAAPPQGGICTDGALRCIYGDTNCACFGRWSCFGGGQCPAEQPPVDSACSESLSTQCRYGTTRCACWGGQWRCL